MPSGECLVPRQPRFLEGVRERIVSNVVEQGGEVDVQLGGGTPRQMIRTQRVLETRVGSPRIDEKCVAELADVAEPLEGWRIDHRQSLGVEADVVPERVADDLELGRGGAQAFGPASRTAAGTSSANCSKFLRNSAASLCACWSYAAGSVHVRRASRS